MVVTKLLVGTDMIASICSTLSGKLALKHPEHGLLVREDGYVFRRIPRTNKKYGWTVGSMGRCGYYVTSIRVGERSVPHTVHRMVAECFIPNYENKPTVDHLNRVRSDNRVVNLRWANYHEQLLNTSRSINARSMYGGIKEIDEKQYRWFKERDRRKDLEDRGYRRSRLCSDGSIHWVRHYSWNFPLSEDLVEHQCAFRIRKSRETIIAERKKHKSEYDRAYRELKGEQRKAHKREYYQLHREEISQRDKIKRYFKRMEKFLNW